MSDFKTNPIEVRITEDNKIIVSKTVISDSVKYERMKFVFHDGWDGYTKTVVFRHYDKTLSVILNGDSNLCTDVDECYIPHEVIKSPEFTVSVFGILGDSRITTPQASIRAIKSGYAEGNSPDDPTLTEYEQLINLSKETKNIAQSVRDDADSGVFKGEKGDKGDPGAIENIDQTYDSESKNAQSGKAIAEVVNSIQTDISSLINNVYDIVTADTVNWYQGSIYKGQLDSSNKKVIASDYIKVKKGDIELTSSMLVRITYYDAQKNYVSDTGTFTILTQYTVLDDGYIRISIGKEDENVTPDMGNSSNIQFYFRNDIIKSLEVKTESLDTQTLIAKEYLSTIHITEKNVLYPIYLLKGNKITVKTKDYSKFLSGTYLKFYDENKKDISAGGWNLSNLTYRNITVTFIEGYTKARYCSIGKIGAEIVIEGDIKQVDKDITNIYNTLVGDKEIPNLSYYGVDIPKKHGFISSEWGGNTYFADGNTAWIQSICADENYLYVYFDTTGINVYSKETGILAHSYSINLGHGNTMSVGNKYETTDDYPLLYVEKEDSGGTYSVVRLGSEAATVVKTFTFPSQSFGTYPQVTWDFENNVCYSIGYKNGTAYTAKSCVFRIGNLQDLTENDDSSFTPTILFSSETTNPQFMQGSCFYNGLIFMGVCNTDFTNSRILMIGSNNGNTLSVIKELPFTGEIEGVYMVAENDIPVLYVSGGRKIYKMRYIK